MSRSTRIILAVMAIALFLCCVAGLGVALLGTRLVGRAVITDPDRVATVSSQIADFRIPPGYEQMFASNVAGVMSLHADSVMIVRTTAPEAVSLLARSAALYAAIPPLTPSRIFAPSNCGSLCVIAFFRV